MRASALIVLALAASPVEAKPVYCVLWPYSPSCQIELVPPDIEPPISAPAPAVPEPVYTYPPPAVTAPIIMPLITRPPAKPPVRPTKITPPAKANKPAAKPKKRIAVSLPWWCTLVPAGTPLKKMEDAAAARGVVVTEEYRAQARACLESKKP